MNVNKGYIQISLPGTMSIKFLHFTGLMGKMLWVLKFKLLYCFPATELCFDSTQDLEVDKIPLSEIDCIWS